MRVPRTMRMKREFFVMPANTLASAARLLSASAPRAHDNEHREGEEGGQEGSADLHEDEDVEDHGVVLRGVAGAAARVLAVVLGALGRLDALHLGPGRGVGVVEGRGARAAVGSRRQVEPRGPPARDVEGLRAEIALD
eukprot:714788-Rhodomonas_salina.1